MKFFYSSQKLSTHFFYVLWAGRFVLLIVFVFVIGFILAKTIFVNGGGDFDFSRYDSPRNTIGNPRYDNGELALSGEARSGESLVFNVTAVGEFSSQKTVLQGEFPRVSHAGSIAILRAYMAFLYPEGDPIVCPRDGTLVRQDNRYGMISQGELRLYPLRVNVGERGYAPEQFLLYEGTSLDACPVGPEITAEERVLPDMLVETEDGYFRFSGEEWESFVSEGAFLSQHRREDVLSITREVFEAYPVSESRLGFLSGTLVAYGESAYVVEGNTLRPIDSPETYIAKGYAWEDIINITGEEFGVYTRGKLYSRKQPHPNGTVFTEESSGNHYVIDEGKKRKITHQALAEQFSSIRAIPASITDLGVCQVEKTWLSWKCFSDWGVDAPGSGAEYEYRYTPSVDARIENIETTLVPEKNRENAKLFFANTIGRLQSRYGL